MYGCPYPVGMVAISERPKGNLDAPCLLYRLNAVDAFNVTASARKSKAEAAIRLFIIDNVPLCRFSLFFAERIDPAI